MVCLSANHRTASLGMLQRLSGLAQSWRPTVARGWVMLATCNRYEVYLDIAEGHDPKRFRHQLALAAGLDQASESDIRIIGSDRVSAHLFAVAAGLESMVFGEREISGQVRRALRDAHLSGTVTPALDQLFQAATATSRQVRAVSGISTGSQSVVRVALDLAAAAIGPWKRLRVVVVGSGSHARAVVDALSLRGAMSMSAWSPSGRTLRHPAIGMLGEHALGSAFGSADLIVTSTNGLALTTARLAAARQAADARHRLLLIDLGLPNNVEPEVGALDGVELLDLATIGDHAPAPELHASARAHAAVESAAAAFDAGIQAAPVITAFRDHVQALLEQEISRVQARGNGQGWSGEATEQALRRFASVLVHGPSTRAHALAAEGRLAEVEAAIATLYDLQSPARAAREVDRPDSAVDAQYLSVG
ncbi:MAG: glutamyl-tRNA reductase [Beutenbergiaceae bacterium]